MSFDEQPAGDIHGECAAEIHRLETELELIRAALDAKIDICGDARISELKAERDALAARVQEMRRLLSVMFDKYEDGTPCYDEPEDGAFIGYAFHLNDDDFNACVKSIATPDTSAQILARRDAAIWMEAAEVCALKRYATDCSYALRAKADELLKGLEKEHDRT